MVPPIGDISAKIHQIQTMMEIQELLIPGLVAVGLVPLLVHMIQPHQVRL